MPNTMAKITQWQLWAYIDKETTTYKHTMSSAMPCNAKQLTEATESRNA